MHHVTFLKPELRHRNIYLIVTSFRERLTLGFTDVTEPTALLHRSVQVCRYP
jgi:hypothetical protein